MAGSRQATRVRRQREPARSRIERGKRGRYAVQWPSAVDQPKPYLGPVGYGSLDEVPRDIQERAFTEKFPWIRRFINEGCPRGKLSEYAKAHATAQGLGEDQVPPYSTLNTWVHRYCRFGAVGLMDAVRGDAGRMRAISREVADTTEVLRLGGRKGPAAALVKLAKQFDGQVLPSYSSVRRFVRRLERDNPHLVVIADEGVAGFRNKYRIAIAGDEYPGGMVIGFDSTVANLWVRVPDMSAPNGWKAVRLVLTVAVDVGSRMLVTFNFSFEAVDAGILCGVLRRVVRQDANYPGLISPGMPRRVLVDQGAEHQGAFRKLLEQHGVEVIATAPNAPETNGRVERIIQSIELEVFAGMNGYSRTQKRFDPYAPAEWDAKRRLSQLKYDPYRLELPVELLPRIEEVEAEVLAWAQLYNARPHKGLPVDSPDLARLLAAAAELDEQDAEEREDV